MESLAYPIYTIVLILALAGAIAIGWFVRGFYDEHREGTYENPKYILQPNYATAPLQPLPQVDKVVPAPVTTAQMYQGAPKKSVVMNFPTPSQTRKRRENETLNEFFASSLAEQERSGSFEVSPDMRGDK